MALSNLLSSAQTSFGTLSQRERRMVLAAGATVVLFTVFMVSHAFSSSADRIRNRTEQKLRQLQEVQELAAGYGDARAAQDELERQLATADVRLISYLEERATQKGLVLPSINPKADVPLEGTKIIESAVELTLTDVKLNRLIEFLQSVEAGPGIVKVKYLRLEPRPKSETITAWLTVATYHLKS
jgi:general secretion pathway protein M